MNVSLAARSAGHRLPTGLRYVTALGLAVTAAIGFGGCETPREPAAPLVRAAIPAEPSLDAQGHPAGLENFHRWSERLAQGGQPAGEVAFANLAAMGYRTILSVDGLRPDAEMAQRYGLRYVHVPFGYDGVPREAQVAIVKAVQASDGPVFIHCHHGVARGPAAAMIVRIATDGLANQQAVADLKAGGCSDRYKGLFRDVLAAVPPTPQELAAVPASLPSYVSPGTLADQMASLDRTWARVGFAKAASWGTPGDRADIDPPYEARLLWEKLRELGRLGDIERHGPDFLTSMQKAEDAGHALEDALIRHDGEAATKSFVAIKSSCDACHARWRD